MKKPVVEFRDFTFQYTAQQEPTLYNIDLTIYEGEKVAIVGPSGSGKSTIGNCINGLIPFSFSGESTGELLVTGMEAKKEGIFSLSRAVGTVLQDPDGQFIGLTVGEDIAFALENDCSGDSGMKAAVLEAARAVDIESHLKNAPHELSGGQKQRVSLAGVMVTNTPILLFDEPLANLDPATGKQAIELIDEIKNRLSATVIIIEHRLEDVLHRPVDRIILMNEGRIAADLPPNELLSGKLLLDYGIREPLYLTALRYADCEITPEMRPESIRDIDLSGCGKKLSDWYESARPAQTPEGLRPLLSVNGLSFAYQSGREVLSDISFSIGEGEMIAIAGKNGAGKSTMAKLICGFEKPQSGSISLLGRDLIGDTIKERAASIGFVMQNPNQMISKPMISEEVGFGLMVSGVQEAERKARVDEALKVCGLYPFRNWPVSALSFGQKKRVTIASILVLGPKIIILDEPTAGQDYRHYTEIMEFLKQLNRQGVTVIMITHDMHLMLEYTDRTLLFSQGRLLADLPPSEVLCNGELIERANLKETSLHTLCERAVPGVPSPQFVRRFIDYDRQVRER